MTLIKKSIKMLNETKSINITFCFIFLLMTIMSFWYGISGDEVELNTFGKIVLKYYTSFGIDMRAISPPKDLDRDGVLQYYGGFFDLVAVLMNKISPLKEYTTRHILNAWAGFLAIFFAAKICVRIGGERMAVICVWLMFLAPFFLGHAMNNPKDIPFATAYIGAIYFFIRFYERLPNVKWTDFIAPIVAIAITIDIRVAGILVIPYMFVWLAGDYLLHKERRKEMKKSVIALVIISVLGYLGASIFWPYALQNPIMNPLTALSELSNFKMGLAQLYQGERVISFDLPASYLVNNFFITNAYILLAGLLISPIFILGSLKNKREFALVVFILFTGVFPLAYIIYKHSNVYHAWRHVLFIFPSLAIVAAYGLNGVLKWVGPGVMKYVVIGVIALGLAEPAYFIVRTFPNTITYYNILAGGTKEAYYNYEMDYYYNSLKEATDWFIREELPKLADKDSIVLATNHGNIEKAYFAYYPKVKVKYVRFYERSMQDWDYGIFHRALIPAGQIQNGGWVSKSTIYEASVFDLPLTVVMKRPSHLDYLGFKALQENRLEEGITDLLNYRKVNNENELVNGLLSRYYLSINQLDSARVLVNEALRKDPDNAQAREVEAVLSGRQ